MKRKDEKALPGVLEKKGGNIQWEKLLYNIL